MKFMQRFRGRFIGAVLGFLLILVAEGIGEIPAQGSFYREELKDGRIYVFNIMKVYEEWKASGELGKSITRVGAGPNGETIFFDSEEAIHLYNFKHDLPGEVILKPEEKKPVFRHEWKDGKTTLEGERAVLILSNRVQVRYTHEQPGDPNASESKGSFRIRRAKTKFEGWIYNKDLTYELQLNWADTAGSLEDASLNYDLTRGKKAFQIKGGQFKVPFGRQELTSSGSQQFVDRSIVSTEFAKGRDIGMQVSGQTPRGALEWRTGIFNGAGRNRSANDNDKFQLNARVTWQPWGDVKYSESDFESSTKPLLAVAAQYEANNQQGSTTGDDIDREVFGGDLVFKYKGLSVFTEYYRRVSAPEVAADFDSTGYNAQVGCFLYRRYIEIALRHAAIDPSDILMTPGSPRANDHRKERGLAFNWFMNKHNLKLQADYRQIEDEARDRTDDEARLQMQFIF